MTTSTTTHRLLSKLLVLFAIPQLLLAGNGIDISPVISHWHHRSFVACRRCRHCLPPRLLDCSTSPSTGRTSRGAVEAHNTPTINSTHFPSQWGGCQCCCCCCWCANHKHIRLENLAQLLHHLLLLRSWHIVLSELFAPAVAGFYSVVNMDCHCCFCMIPSSSVLFFSVQLVMAHHCFRRCCFTLLVCFY